jgi:hypothetical protein
MKLGLSSTVQNRECQNHAHPTFLHIKGILSKIVNKAFTVWNAYRRALEDERLVYSAS